MDNYWCRSKNKKKTNNNNEEEEEVERLTGGKKCLAFFHWEINSSLSEEESSFSRRKYTAARKIILPRQLEKRLSGQSTRDAKDMLFFCFNFPPIRKKHRVPILVSVFSE